VINFDVVCERKMNRCRVSDTIDQPPVIGNSIDFKVGMLDSKCRNHYVKHWERMIQVFLSEPCPCPCYTARMMSSFYHKILLLGNKYDFATILPTIDLTARGSNYEPGKWTNQTKTNSDASVF